MGLLSGRSRHTSRKARSDRESKVSDRRKERKEGEDVVEVKPPDLEELRRRRAEYYSVPPAERRRTSGSAVSRTATKRPSSTALRSSRESRRRSRKDHSSSSTRAERACSESQRATEDYVYGPRSSDTPDRDVKERTGDDYEEARSASRRSRQSTPSRRQSLATVIENEVTPEDSISQVGERDASETKRRRASVRPSLKRSSTTSSRLAPIPGTSRDTPSAAPSRRSSRTTPKPQATVRRHSTTSVPTPPQLVECLTCGSDDVPIAQSAKLACDHRMCHECLKRIFEMSVKDPIHMPPKCCTDQYIPLKHVDKIFDTKFKMLWNRKYQEYHTKNRIYCPTLKCAEWIKPSHIHTSQGRKYALCPRCKTKVCMLCNNKLHKATECPKDPEIAKLVEQAKSEGWQRCYSCNAFVERREGCNHMTCRCRAEFCILCGSKWKTCECPWFNYAHLPDPDRLNNMRVPEPIQFIYRQVFGAAANQAIPPPPMGDAAPAPEPAPNPRPYPRRGPNAREVTYQQELNQRRRQERLDEDLARRLQLASLLEPEGGENARRLPGGEPFGMGHIPGAFLNDEFVQNAANVVMNAFGDANLGGRGERHAGRRRRARPARQNTDDTDFGPNFPD